MAAGVGRSSGGAAGSGAWRQTARRRFALLEEASAVEVPTGAPHRDAFLEARKQRLSSMSRPGACPVRRRLRPQGPEESPSEGVLESAVSPDCQYDRSGGAGFRLMPHSFRMGQQSASLGKAAFPGCGPASAGQAG
jgi:hypothetical protein